MQCQNPPCVKVCPVTATLAFLVTILTYVVNLKHFEGIAPLSASWC